MRKATGFAFVLALSCLGLTPSAAATKAQAITTVFTSLLSATEDSITALDLKLGQDINSLELSLENATAVANATHTKEITDTAKIYSVIIDDVTNGLNKTRIQFDRVNSVRILSLGTKRSYWANLDCPDYEPACKDVDNIEKFEVGDVTGIKDSSGLKPENLIEIDQMVAQGLIEIVYRDDYLTVSKQLKTAFDELEGVQAQYSAVQNNAVRKRDSAIERAEKERDQNVVTLNNDHQAAKAPLVAQQTAATLALLAAKRASKDPNFEAALAVAYKFEYNHKMLEKISTSSWTGESKFKTINSVAKVKKLATTSEAISVKYTKSAADAFNSAVGKAFMNDPEFKASLKILVDIYKQISKTPLKF